MKQIWNKIIRGTEEFFENAGFEKAIIGLSGGIDSAVVAVIAQVALGGENVVGVLMPSPHSSLESMTDSDKLASNLLIETKFVRIDNILDSFVITLDRHFESRNGIIGENIQARIRAVLLMAFCNKYHALLLNTGNKSELYTGYFTLYGDSCGAIAPIGDLYKTDVYKLAHWINKQTDLPDIPKQIIDKPPSAELRHDQKDEDDLPPYDVLDPILRLFIDDNFIRDGIVERGHSRDLVDKIANLICLSEFKRRQSPPVIKL